MRCKRLFLVLMAVVMVISLTCCTGSKGAADTDALKSYTVQVGSSDGTVASYEGETEEQYLQGVMDELAGREDFSYEEDGGMLISINGERADYNEDHAYWAIYVNDEYGTHGIADQPVEEGDVFKFEYTPAE